VSERRSWLLTLSTTSYHSSFIGVSRSEDRTCNGRNGVAVAADICGEKNARLRGWHDCSECEGQRDNRERSVGKVSGRDFRRSELAQLVQVFVDGLNGLRESGRGRT
jgi:hypothetical protein